MGADGSAHTNGDQEYGQHTDAEIAVEDNPLVRFFPPPPVSPLSWEDRNSRLEALQEGLLKVAEETLLKKKKKPSPG
jgi:hypothetical protein